MLNSAEFWVAISFIIFVILTYKAIKNYFSSLLLKRKNDIIEDIHYVDSLKNEASKLLLTHSNNKKNIQNELEQISKDTKMKIEHLKSQNKQKMEHSIKAYENKMYKKIESTENLFIENIKAGLINEVTQSVKNILLQHHTNILNKSSLLDNSISKINLEK